MQQSVHIWFAGIALALSIGGMGNSIYSSNNDQLDQQIIRLEREHKDDVSDLRKKHDEDITAVRFQMNVMDKGLHLKLDSILASMTFVHVDVKVNSSKIDRLEKGR